jgi:hypothetical protein
LDKIVEERLRNRIHSYRRLLLVVSITNIVITCFVIIMAFAILTAKSRVQSLAQSTLGLSNGLTRIEHQSDRTYKQLVGIEAGTKPVTDTVTVILNAYAGLERCNVDDLPIPSGEFDPAVLPFFERSTYAGLRSNIPGVARAQDEMLKTASVWASSRPASAYIHLVNRLHLDDEYKMKLVDALGSAEQSYAARFTFEKEAVFVACLRQVGLLEK